MADYFHEACEGLKQSADGLIEANLGIERAAEAALNARDEHFDLRDTVDRLEALVLVLTRESRSLRDGRRNDG